MYKYLYKDLSVMPIDIFIKICCYVIVKRDRNPVDTAQEARTLVFRCVFTYYNRLRVYTANPYGQPPEQLRDAALGLAA